MNIENVVQFNQISLEYQTNWKVIDSLNEAKILIEMRKIKLICVC